MPTNKETSKRRQSTTIERVTIIELTAEEYSRRGIQQKLGISKSTVQRVIQECSQLQPASRSGRPPTLNPRDKRGLYRLSDANPYASLRDLAAESGLGVCSETVTRALRASGRYWYVRWARHKPYICEGNRLKRVKLARSQRRTTVEEWQSEYSQMKFMLNCLLVVSCMPRLFT